MYKQYILILKKYRDVSKGKFGAHCGHAALTAALNGGVSTDRFIEWYGKAQTKILKVVPTLNKLKTIIEGAMAQGYGASLIPDNGASGEVPKGTVIMGCVGPITEDEAADMGILKLSNLK